MNVALIKFKYGTCLRMFIHGELSNAQKEEGKGKGIP